ncbi:sensor histidine kinase [Pontiellaceae bacterium B12227]|nr:sensor histidine kinase [Pontiellaceae bacterium B12227]
MSRYRTFWAVALLLLAGSAVAQNPYKSIQDIRILKPAEAARGLAVEVESQLVWVDPLRGSFFLNDGTNGIYVRYRLKEDEACTLKPGDVVRVAGRTGAGNFAPEILPDSVNVVGHRPLPPGKNFWFGNLDSPTIDCDWIELRGRMISYEIIPDAFAIAIEMVREGRSMFIQLPLNPENEKRLPELMFHWLKFNAVVGTVHNGNRQSVGRIFHVSSAEDFVIDGASLTEALSEVQSAQPIHELMQLDMNHRSIVKTYGTVTHVDEREVFLRGEKAALDVRMQNTAHLSVGDVIEVVGLTLPQEITPAFRAHSAELLRKEPEPLPVKLASVSAVNDTLNYDLIEIDAQLVEIGRSFGVIDADIAVERQIKLLCSSGGKLFEAHLPAGSSPGDSVKPGATVRLTGLCHVVRENWRPWTLDIDGFRLQLRSSSDIEVLASAAWWTPVRLFWLAGSALAVSMLFFVWVLLLRKTVDRQTRIIGDKVERETTLNERQRIARELHDNLEQGLAGATIQLSGCRRLVELNKEQLLETLAESVQLADAADPELQSRLKLLEKDLIDAAAKSERAISVVDNMITHCSDESRATILELRGGLLEKMDLVSAIEVSMNPLAEECGAELVYNVTGRPARLELDAERNLLFLIKEAVSNATRHASPSRIEVGIHFSEDGLRLFVQDNGCGFVTDALPKVGRFGLQGMRERAKQLSADITIESEVGSGSRVSVEMKTLKNWLVD